MMNIDKITEPRDKNKYEESIKAFVDDLDKKLHLLREKKSEVDATVEELFQAKIDYLTQKRELLNERMQLIRATSTEKWEETFSTVDAELKKIVTEAETAYIGIKKGFGYLFEKFKSEEV